MANECFEAILIGPANAKVESALQRSARDDETSEYEEGDEEKRWRLGLGLKLRRLVR